MGFWRPYLMSQTFDTRSALMACAMLKGSPASSGTSCCTATCEKPYMFKRLVKSGHVTKNTSFFLTPLVEVDHHPLASHPSGACYEPLWSRNKETGPRQRRKKKNTTLLPLQTTSRFIATRCHHGVVGFSGNEHIYSHVVNLEFQSVHKHVTKTLRAGRGSGPRKHKSPLMWPAHANSFT